MLSSSIGVTDVPMMLWFPDLPAPAGFFEDLATGPGRVNSGGMPDAQVTDAQDRCDVLVVGAGPTGLTLAAQLDAFGVDVRLVDKATDRTRESRALAVQPRTLEVLRPFGLAAELVERGNPAVRLRLHAGRRLTQVRLFDIGLDDTAFPFLLFISQAETEEVLGRHLAGRGVRVDRGTTFEGFHDHGDGLTCDLRAPDGARRQVRTRWLVGCDGAHSTVRQLTGTAFTGGRYPQTFLLADLAVDGLEPGTVNAFLGRNGPLLLFPLNRPAPWRLITMRPTTETGGSRGADGAATDPTEVQSVSLAELQALTDEATDGRLRLRDPVWATAFRIHHRHAGRYRTGRVFLAGDAVHIHSPAGAQGMNTGIQDAVNLGWKLALVTRGTAPPELLDSYDAERRPVGAFVLRFTDRAFTAVTSPHPLLRAARTHVAPRVLPVALRLRAGRRLAFRTVSQLGIRYRNSPAVDTGDVRARRRHRGPLPGDRLPDGRITRDGQQGWLHEALTAPGFHLLLCGRTDGWDAAAVESLRKQHGDLLTVHHLDRGPGPGVLADPGGRVLKRLRVHGSAALLVRPDGHLGYRADHTDLTGAQRFLARWLPGG
jgi:2-polyprenyl-6-methoxyphenol hydroxylase-like FAD-dependent oxidoreductase